MTCRVLWAGLVGLALTACDGGPTEVRKLSELSDAALRALGDYNLQQAWDPTGQAFVVDTQRVAVRQTGVTCAGNGPLARSIGLDGRLTLAAADRVATVVLTSYGTRCNDSTFTFHVPVISKFTLEERYLTLVGGSIFPGVVGEVDPDSDTVTLDFGQPGLPVFQAFASTVQIEYVSRIRLHRR